MNPTTSREIRLASRPSGFPTADNFELASTEVAPPGEGQVLVRNLFMSVDPYMRGRMNDVRSYIAPFEVGEVLEGGAIGRVVETRVGAIAAGSVVLSNRGWREAFAADAAEVTVVDPKVQPASLWLGALGMPGMTAWVGIRLGDLKSGETLFVSAAAGAVGSVAGQLANLRGCRVIGSAGSPAKVRVLLDELGFDAAFDYKEGDVAGQLRAAAPSGIDAYFDNVGGEHLEAALEALRVHGRVVACGAISGYNAKLPPRGPRNLPLIVGKRLTIRGFLVRDWTEQKAAFLAEVGPLLAEGKLKTKETVVEGIERAPQAFLDLLHGANIGKMVVKLIPGPP
jgi:NADPH-dependent curcumin reductase CurA